MSDKRSSGAKTRTKTKPVRKKNRKPSLFSALAKGTEFTNHYEARYVLNLFDQASHGQEGAYSLIAAFESEYGSMPGFPFEGKPDPEEDNNNRPVKYSTRKTSGRVQKADWDSAKEFLQAKIDSTAEVVEEQTPLMLQSYIKLLEHLGFDEDAIEAARLIYVYMESYRFHTFYEEICEDRNRAGQVIAHMLGKPDKIDKFKKLIDRRGQMDEFGLIDHNGLVIGSGELGMVPLPDMTVLKKIEGLSDPKEIIHAVVGKEVKTELGRDDFEMLTDDIDAIVEEIVAAVESGEKGVNIMLIGEEGAGKTELAKVLAKQAGKRLISIGENTSNIIEMFDSEGDPEFDTMYNSTHVLRARELLRAQKIFEGNKDVILLLDEAEDLMPPGMDSEKAADPDNKVATNRLVEENAVVTIMAINDPKKFHRSFLDRFQIKLYVDTPPTLTRQQIWEKQAARVSVDLPEEDARYLARNYEIAPRKIVIPLKSAARRNVESLKAIEERLRKNAIDASAIRTANPIPREFDTSLYEFEGDESADEKTQRLIEIAKAKYPFSLFVTVGQGMEEGALLAYIAEQAQMNIDIVDASTLMVESPFSNPFSNISGLFNAADNFKRMVAVTNVDLLADWASKSEDWGKTPIVQHFRQEAAKHTQPFIVTCPHSKQLVISKDFQAIFSEQARLVDLTQDGLPAAFESIIGMKLPKEGLEDIDLSGARLADLYAAKQLISRQPGIETARQAAEIVAEQWRVRKAANQEPRVGF